MRGDDARRLRAEPNVTPMLDVMLVLLIISMVLTPMLLSPGHATPPDAAHLRAHPEEAGDHTLGIDPHGNLYLDRRLTARSDVPARLDSIFARSDDRVLYVRADRWLRYGAVVDALHMAGAHGVRTVGLVGRPAPPPPPAP